jgi:uncharacterized membrane protein
VAGTLILALLIAGLALFLAPHLAPVLPPLRLALVSRAGDRGYRLAFSLASAAGLLMIVLGYAYADRGPQLFAPLAAARALAPYVMVLVFILLASSHTPSHLRATVKHPMLLGILLWSAVHLGANGDLRGTVLFGAFFAYAVVDLASVVQRGAVASFEPRVRADLVSVIAGIVAALLVMTFHRVLFGVPVVPFGS